MARPWGAGVARRVARRALPGMVVLALGGLVVPAPALARDEALPRAPIGGRADPVAPDRTPGLDAVLDGVPVDPSPALRRADLDIVLAAQEHQRALFALMGAERDRLAVEQRVQHAGRDVAEAEAQRGAAQVREAAAVRSLQRLTLIETARRADLAVQQRALRRLAAAVFTSAPADRYRFFGDWNDISASARRDAVRDRGVGAQSDRVEATRRPWAAAVAARQAGERRVSAERAAIVAADDARAAAIGLREHESAVLAQTSAKAADARQAFDRADAGLHGAMIARRDARLGATVTGTDLPLVALHAYWRASGASPCGLPWWVLAGIGRSETRHGTAFGSRLSAGGDTPFTILGVRLDGHPGVAAVADTDGGAFDQDPLWDRAVGPMQFLPGTWARWAVDENDDGRADPNNIYDAALAAADYLCFTRRGPLTDADLPAVVLTYNRSDLYVAAVLTRGHAYRSEVGLPDLPPVTPAG